MGSSIAVFVLFWWVLAGWAGGCDDFVVVELIVRARLWEIQQRFAHVLCCSV